MYLIDTNVLSHLAPRRVPRPAGDPLSAWIAANAGAIWISVVTVAEIGFGVAELRRRGATRRAAMLDAWLGRTTEHFADRLLPVTAAIARQAGVLLSRAVGAGRDPGMEDALIAATGEHHGFAVLTRNGADFAALGVRSIDPFGTPPRD